MSLVREVSPSELLHMREDGMSNQEIANALDVSYQTVLRVIGKQPSNLRKPAVRNFAAPMNAAPIHEKEEPEACLAVLSRNVSLMGNLAEYSLDCAEDILTMKVGEGTVCVPFQKIGLLINELAAIQRNIPRVKIGNEMW